MNVTSLTAEIREELQEASVGEWTAAEILDYLNRGNRLIAQFLEWHEKTSNIVTVLGQQDYTFPTDILKLHRATFDREFLPQTTQYELDRDEGNWRGSGNNNPIRFFLKQWDTLSLYPKPKANGTIVSFDSELGALIAVEDPSGTPDPDVTFDSELGIIIAVEDSQGGHIRFEPDYTADPFTTTSAELGEVIDYDTDEDNVALYYAALPDTLVAGTDSPQIHQAAHPALVPYAVYRCLSREGPMQDIGLAEAYFGDFADWMQAVMLLKDRQWPEASLSLEPVAMGSQFIRRLNEIGHGSLPRASLRAHYE